MRAITFVSSLALLVAACGAAAPPVPISTSGTHPAASAVPTVAVTATAAVTPTATVTQTPTTPPDLATPSEAATLAPSAVAVRALDARFLGPHGLALDAAGNLYVTECDWTWAVIDKIDPNGIVTRFAGTGSPGFSGDSGPATNAQLYCPAGIAVGPDGLVYFADHLNNRIRRVDAAGIITTFAGSGAAGLDRGSFSGDGGPAALATLQEPWGVAFDESGRLYIADRDNVRVRRVDTSGDITTVAGTGAEGASGDGGSAIRAEICKPVGIAIDPQGNIVLPNNCASPIRVVDGDGIITTLAATTSGVPIPDYGSEGNAIFDPNGAMIMQAGSNLVRFERSGGITTLAGNGQLGTPADGSVAVDAPLPGEFWGLAADGAGNVYLASGPTSVWRVDTNGIIHLFAGKQT